MADIDWAGMTSAQHKTAFAVLAWLHADVISHVRIGEGHDNTELFALAADINHAMQRGNDELVRREVAMTGGGA